MTTFALIVRGCLNVLCRAPYFCTMNFVNTVDIRVGSFIRQWVEAVEGSDCVRVDKFSNIWAIIKPNLDLLPADFQIPDDKGEFIRIELLDAHNNKSYNRTSDKDIHLNYLYRCYVSETGQAAIKRYLENQFRAAFRAYMIGRTSDDQPYMITRSIGSFLSDYNLPRDDKTIVSRLSKDWYRYRQKNPGKYALPIFF